MSYILDKLDNLKGMNDRVLARSFHHRTLALLLIIMQEPFENQRYYVDSTEWTNNSLSIHARILIDYGFVIQEKDERDFRMQSKRMYVPSFIIEKLEEYFDVSFEEELIKLKEGLRRLNIKEVQKR